MSWRNYETNHDTLRIIDVVPVDDCMPHVVGSGACLCGAYLLERIVRTQRTVEVYTHIAEDGRDQEPIPAGMKQ